MTLVIGGKDYTLSPDEWMFDPQTVQLAQGAQQVSFSMGPVGPQILAQIEHKPEEDTNAQTEAENINKKRLQFKS